MIRAQFNVFFFALVHNKKAIGVIIHLLGICMSLWMWPSPKMNYIFPPAILLRRGDDDKWELWLVWYANRSSTWRKSKWAGWWVNKRKSKRPSGRGRASRRMPSAQEAKMPIWADYWEKPKWASYCCRVGQPKWARPWRVEQPKWARRYYILNNPSGLEIELQSVHNNLFPLTPQVPVQDQPEIPKVNTSSERTKPVCVLPSKENRGKPPEMYSQRETCNI